jgi:hypothetical protein
MARLAANLDDLRAAMDWAAESGNLRGLVDITEPIVRFWFEAETVVTAFLVSSGVQQAMAR